MHTLLVEKKHEKSTIFDLAELKLALHYSLSLHPTNKVHKNTKKKINTSTHPQRQFTSDFKIYGTIIY